MPARRALLALAVLALAGLALPPDLLAWTPGTHIHLGESVLQQLHRLPPDVADLLRAFPLDFLYGSIAPDSSLAKKYAPRGRHSHAWHVGDELVQQAPSDALRAFGMGWLAHLAADTVAHNYYVPRQLLLTTVTPNAGHAYWESRVEAELGPRVAREARELLREGHAAADAYMDRLIAPTLFPVRVNRRLFRGMVQVADWAGWQHGMRLVRARTRWPLPGWVVERHLDWSLRHVLGALGAAPAAPRALDPAGAMPLARAKQLRRRALAAGGDREGRLEAVAAEHFGLPDAAR
ncbi:MAG: zinc dependent phospholipase C family protein [Gemmatimonadales bacterium]|nr:zinc dependent phospholipase C family protein [Gemmatimonadales bacterium]